MSEKIFYRQERALSSHFPRLHGVHGAIFSDFSAVCKKKLTQGALPLDPSRDAVPAPCKGVPPLTLSRDWVERTFMLYARAAPTSSVAAATPSPEGKAGMGNRAPKPSPLGKVPKADEVGSATIHLNQHGCALRRGQGGERRLRLFSCPLVASAEANPLLHKSTFPQKSNSAYLEAFAKASRSPTVRLNTGSSAVESGSLQK